MALVVNYKLLDPENTSVTPQQQLVSIYNKVYGGNIKEEISDTVQLIAEAGIMETVTQYNANDFYEKRGEVQWNIYLAVKALLKDYYITCSGVSIVNMEFNDSYQRAIAAISAETQLIEEKNNLLAAETIAAATNVQVATTSKTILIEAAKNEGQVYAALTGKKATAIQTYYTNVKDTISLVAGLDSTASGAPIYNFYYMLVIPISYRP
jgi:hypothetical protein